VLGENALFSEVGACVWPKKVSKSVILFFFLPYSITNLLDKLAVPGVFKIA